MGWSMDCQGIRTLFDRVTGRLKQFELSGPRRERVSLDTYSDELAARDAEFRQEARQWGFAMGFKRGSHYSADRVTAGLGPTTWHISRSATTQTPLRLRSLN